MSDSDFADSQESDPSGRRQPRQVFMRVLGGAPDQLAGTLYGTIVVLAIIAAGSTSHAAQPWDLVDLVISSTIVLWIAHVYAHGVAESVREGHRLRGTELRGVAWREAAIVLSAVLPVVALMLGALHVMPENSAVWIAIGLCLVTLAIEALRYARLERLSTTATVLTTGMNLFIGVLIVALKIQMGH